MNNRIEIYPGGQLPMSHSLGLEQIIRPALERLMGYPLEHQQLRLLIQPVYCLDSPQSTVFNMAPDYGYAIVMIGDAHGVMYQHPHRLTELLGPELEQRLGQEYPNQNRWGYRVVGPNLAELPLVLPTPLVQGASWGTPERARFRIRPLVEDPPPAACLADFGLDEQPAPHNQAAVRVLVHAPLLEELNHHRPFSNRVEEGGFLTGRLYRDSKRSNCWLAEIQRAPMAQHTGASLLHLTFTGDSFSQLKQELPSDRRIERLLGWYHSHLFEAREEMGLSSIDLELHYTTFRQPWQLAGLVNLEPGGGRVLRFYVRSGANMLLCPCYAVDGKREVRV